MIQFKRHFRNAIWFSVGITLGLSLIHIFPRRGTPPEEISPGAESERKVHSMKQKLAALLAVLAVLLAACGPAAGNSGSSGSTQSSGVEKTPMEEDLDLFTSTLEENHKNLYANISKEEFQAEVEQVRAELPGMSEGQFYYSLRRLLSLVGDAHTSLGFTCLLYTSHHSGTQAAAGVPCLL